MKKIIIDGVMYVPKTEPAALSNYSIFRCKNAGVHLGVIGESDGTFTQIKNSRRLWRWWSKATLSELAMEGPLTSKIAEQRYGCIVPSLGLNDSDICEIIPCTEVAAKAMLAVAVWGNK